MGSGLGRTPSSEGLGWKRSHGERRHEASRPGAVWYWPVRWQEYREGNVLMSPLDRDTMDQAGKPGEGEENVFFFLNVYFWERERECRRGAETDGDTESKIGSRLQAVSTEPDTTLELTNHDIMTWAEVRCLTEPLRCPRRCFFKEHGWDFQIEVASTCVALGFSFSSTIFLWNYSGKHHCFSMTRILDFGRNFCFSKARMILLGKRVGDTWEEMFNYCFCLLPTSKTQGLLWTKRRETSTSYPKVDWFWGHLTSTTPYYPLCVFSHHGTTVPEKLKRWKGSWQKSVKPKGRRKRETTG